MLQALYSLHLGSHPHSETDFLNDAIKILNSGAECLSVDVQRLRGLVQVSSTSFSFINFVFDNSEQGAFFSELCSGKAMSAYTMPQQWKKEESERVRGEIKSSLLILDLKGSRVYSTFLISIFPYRANKVKSI